MVRHNACIDVRQLLSIIWTFPRFSRIAAYDNDTRRAVKPRRLTQLFKPLSALDHNQALRLFIGPGGRDPARLKDLFQFLRFHRYILIFTYGISLFCQFKKTHFICLPGLFLQF
ncbi:MAG: hypothetical protein DELT_03201 [Desulfovibrio sp.]